jgi:hypothetical protein
MRSAQTKRANRMEKTIFIFTPINLAEHSTRGRASSGFTMRDHLSTPVWVFLREGRSAECP